MPRSSQPKSLTPMLRQYYELKEQVGDALLFFRMGDFYELFDKDASLVAPLLGIVLTAREKGDQTKVPFCGVPHHSYQHYMMKLLRLGYKVALAEQFNAESTANSSSLMHRRVVRIHTPGCTDELEALGNSDPLYLAAAYECPNTQVWILALCEYSTGQLRLGSLPHLEALKEQLSLHSPKELLIRRFQEAQFKSFATANFPESSPLVLSHLPEEALRHPTLQGDWQQLLQHSHRSFSEAEKSLLASLQGYLKELHAHSHHILTIEPLDRPHTMALGDVVVRDLELLYSQGVQRGSKGSLWSIIHHTLTPMGSRRLRERVLRPYTQKTKIEKSHDLIQGLLLEKAYLMKALRSSLKPIADLERLSKRALREASLPPSQVLVIKNSLKKALEISQTLEKIKGEKKDLWQSLKKAAQESLIAHQHSCSKAEPLYKHLKAVLNEQPGELGSGTVIRRGYNKDYDEALQYHQEADRHLRRYEEHLRKRYAIPSLKVRSHKTYGLLLEVTKTHASKVDESFRLKQTMVNAQRYTTDDLEAQAQALGQAEERTRELECSLYQSEVLDFIAHHQSELISIAAALAKLDVSGSLAYLAHKHHYTRPKIGSGDRIYLKEGHHPVVASSLPPHSYTTTSVDMKDPHKQMLITGPNMGGKSTVMRQVALSALLSQMGSYVPCQEAELPIFDALFTRIGASDDLAGGRSTFMVEMSEAAGILRRSTHSSLVILDELGRGTSTEDGVALAYSILHEFAAHKKSWMMFATHYHELAALSAPLKSVRLWQTEVLQKDGSMNFSYRLIPGVCSHSFGLATAKLAGIPQAVLERAQNHLSHSLKKQPAAPQPPKTTSPHQALKLWQELKDLNPEELTPLTALHLILEWKEDTKSSSSSDADEVTSELPQHSPTTPSTPATLT